MLAWKTKTWRHIAEGLKNGSQHENGSMDVMCHINGNLEYHKILTKK